MHIMIFIFPQRSMPSDGDYKIFNESLFWFQYLDVSYNKIKRLQPKTLERIGNFFKQPENKDSFVRKLNMIGNPFVCDCTLRPMFDWLSNTQANLYSRDRLRCYTGVPEANAGMLSKIMFFLEKLSVHNSCLCICPSILWSFVINYSVLKGF